MAPLRRAARKSTLVLIFILEANALTGPACAIGRGGGFGGRAGVYESYRSETFRTEPPGFERTQRENKGADEQIHTFTNFAEITTYSIFAGQRDSQARDALRKELEHDKIAQRLHLLSWTFSKPPSLSTIDAILRNAKRVLPGQVELGLFIDGKTYGESYRAILDAWKDRPLSEPPESDLMSAYMGFRRGKTLILVGHVEGKSYVFYNSKSQKASVSIQKLGDEAARNGVALFLLGCETAHADAPLGFLHPISTEEVTSFLKSVPADNATVADLLGGMALIGPLLKANLGDGESPVEIQAHREATANENSQEKDGSPFTRAYFSFSSSGQQGASPFIRTVNSNADQARPFYSQSWIVEFLSNPLTYIFAWITLVMTSWLSSIVLRRWALERRDRQRLFRIVRFPAIVTYQAGYYAFWTIFYVIWLGALPTFIIGGYFLDGWNLALTGFIVGSFVVVKLAEWKDNSWMW